jgi:hypothetical protein
VTDAVRSYLQHEWERKCAEGAAAAAKAAAGSGGSSGRGAGPRRGGGGDGPPGGVAYAWAAAHPGLPPLRVDRAVLPHKRLESLPRQVGGLRGWARFLCP